MEKEKNKKNKRKKKNMERTQIKLNTPHVRCNVKVLPQQLMIRDK